MIHHSFISLIIFIIGAIISEICIMLGLKGPSIEKKILSLCNNCNERYKWYELIPIISYFYNNGKCNYCRNSIPTSYLLLNVFGAISFLLSYFIYGLSYEMMIMQIIISLFIVITISDLKYYVILDSSLVISSLLILILKYTFYGKKVLLLSIISGLLIFLFMYVIKIIGDKIFKTESLGGGDIKLSLIFGFILGIRLSVISLVVGSFLAFPFALYATFVNDKREIPFGPFLMSGLAITFIFMDILNKFFAYIF